MHNVSTKNLFMWMIRLVIVIKVKKWKIKYKNRYNSSCGVCVKCNKNCIFCNISNVLRVNDELLDENWTLAHTSGVLWLQSWLLVIVPKHIKVLRIKSCLSQPLTFRTKNKFWETLYQVNEADMNKKEWAAFLSKRRRKKENFMLKQKTWFFLYFFDEVFYKGYYLTAKDKFFLPYLVIITRSANQSWIIQPSLDQVSLYWFKFVAKRIQVIQW